MIRFSDIFGSSESDGDGGNRSEAAAVADANIDAGNDGARVEADRYSRDKDGGESHDRTSFDSGRTDASSGVKLASSTENSNDEGAASNGDVPNGGTGEAAEDGGGADQAAEADGGISNSGARFESEHYHRDEDGAESYDQTVLESGATDVSFGLGIGGSADGAAGLFSGSDDYGSFE